MTQCTSKPIPSSCSHRKSKMFGFLLTCVAFIHTAGWAMDLMLTSPLYHMPKLAVWVLHPLLFLHVAITIHALNKSQAREKRWESRFHESLSFVANYRPLSDLGGRGQAVPMYWTAHMQWVQCAGESIWASWQKNSWEQDPPPVTITCSLPTFLVTAKRKNGTNGQGNCSAECIRPWDLEWAPSAGLGGSCGQTSKHSRTALTLLILFASHHGN